MPRGIGAVYGNKKNPVVIQTRVMRRFIRIVENALHPVINKYLAQDLRISTPQDS